MGETRASVERVASITWPGADRAVRNQLSTGVSGPTRSSGGGSGGGSEVQRW